MSSLNVTLTLYPNYGIMKSKPVFCIQKDIQLFTIAQVKDQMVKKLKGILKNQQTGLGQGNVTLTLFFLLF